MIAENFFKVSFIIIIVLFFFFRSFYVRHYKKFSPKFLIKYLLAILFISLYFSGILDFAQFRINLAIRFVLGLVLIFSGFFLFFLSHKYLGKNWNPHIEDKFPKSRTLITSGPYRYVRHPIYLASFISLIGLGIYSANSIIFSIPLLILILFYFYKIPREENSLIKNFGKRYIDYKMITPSIFPFTNLWQ